MAFMIHQKEKKKTRKATIKKVKRKHGQQSRGHI